MALMKTQSTILKPKKAFKIILIMLLAGCTTYQYPHEARKLTSMPEEALICDYRNFKLADEDVLIDGPQEIIRRHPEWPLKVRHAISYRHLIQGMTKHQVLALTGWPLAIKIKNSFLGKEEQWEVADGPQFLYFQNNKLEGWADEEKVEFFDIPMIQADSKSILIPKIFPVDS
ncbi:MAG: hypothetical protein HY587_04580 [Candidatus Omnitrophica bacterium]|nr:hypothetical protein [Candidatus Omnitrophota bacterium]